MELLGRHASIRAHVWVIAASVLSACVPDVDVDESLVVAPRLLAVSAQPAEGAASESSRYQGLWVGPEGTLDDADLSFAHCIARKPLAELGPVSQACLQSEGDALVPLGVGQSVQGVLPADVCSLFGPIAPTAADGMAAGRPVDPDTTGGYNLPVRVTTPDGQQVFFEQRVRCDLVGATQAQSAEYRRNYKRNGNPSIESVALVHADGRVDAIDALTTAAVAPGERVTLRVQWPSCPTEPSCGDGLCNGEETRQSCREDCIMERGCGGAETYLYFDPIARELTERSEAMRLAWFSTDGVLRDERTGVGEDGDTRASDNTWTAPTTPSETTLWVVLRDSRGGVGWTELRVQVE